MLLGGRQNRLIGGVLLNQARSKAQVSCSGKNSDLIFKCRVNNGDGHSINKKRAPMDHAYGNDPTFLPTSSLFIEEYSTRIEWFYNISNNAEINLESGLPYAFNPCQVVG